MRKLIFGIATACALSACVGDNSSGESNSEAASTSEVRNGAIQFSGTIPAKDIDGNLIPAIEDQRLKAYYRQAGDPTWREHADSWTVKPGQPFSITAGGLAHKQSYDFRFTVTRGGDGNDESDYSNTVRKIAR